MFPLTPMVKTLNNVLTSLENGTKYWSSCSVLHMQYNFNMHNTHTHILLFWFKLNIEGFIEVTKFLPKIVLSFLCSKIPTIPSTMSPSIAPNYGVKCSFWSVNKNIRPTPVQNLTEGCMVFLNAGCGPGQYVSGNRCESCGVGTFQERTFHKNETCINCSGSSKYLILGII